MHIKYVTNVRLPTPRAQGYAIMKMCSEFTNRGARVALFVPDRQDTDFIGKDPFGFYNVEKNFEIKRIKSFDFLGKTLKFGRLFYWLDILSFLLVTKFSVKLEKKGILYTRDFLVTLFFTKSNFIVLELHDIPTNKFLFKKAIAKPKLFFVLNQNIKNELISMGVDENKIHIAPSGVNIEDFDINFSKEEARKTIDLPIGKSIVLYSGQLYSWKGADTLAEAAKILPEYFFVFVGGVEPEISEFKKNYSSLLNIKILPSVERKLVPIYLKAADVLVVPNSAKEKISTHFTSPLKLIEYMASKRPIVASDLPSIRLVVGDREVCFAKPDDLQSFADAIGKVLTGGSYTQSLVENSFKKVQGYSWSKRAEKIIGTIKKSYAESY